MISLLGTSKDHICLTFFFFFPKSTAFKLFSKPLQNSFAQIKSEWPFYPHSYHFFPFHLVKTSKPSGVKTLYKLNTHLLMHLAGLQCQVATAFYFSPKYLCFSFDEVCGTFASLLRAQIITYSEANGTQSSLTLCWYCLCFTYIFSVSLFPQCQGNLTQTRFSQPRGSGDNSFQTLFPLIHLLVRFLTGHQTVLFPSQGKSGTHWSLVSGDIKD